MASANLAVAERSLFTQLMQESKYLRVSCKTGLKQANGSMMIIFDSEPEESCAYRIVNNSTRTELLFC